MTDSLGERLMGWERLQCCAPVDDPQGVSPFCVRVDLRPEEVVRVPLQAILYLQPMAENGLGDQPKPRGHALPDGHVRYRQ